LRIFLEFDVEEMGAICMMLNLHLQCDEFVFACICSNFYLLKNTFLKYFLK
jgi:hypothetical protein